MEESVRQRIKEVLFLNSSNINKLANDDTAFQNRLSRQINQGAAISCDTILRFLSTYPNVSADWLLMGKGEMYFENSMPKFEGVESEEEENLKIEVSKLKAEKEELLTANLALKDEITKKVGYIEGQQDFISKLIIENNILSQRLDEQQKKTIV